MFGQQNFSCLACGVDLWDVERSVRAGGAVLCGHCALSMAGRRPARSLTVVRARRDGGGVIARGSS